MCKKLVLSVVVIAAIMFSMAVTAAGNIQNISNDELKSLLASGVILVDIRTPSEWAETGVVEGSHAITLFGEDGRPMPDFLPKLEEIASKDTPIIVMCRTGSRTRVASQALTQQVGFSKVYNLSNGIMDWIAKGNPVVEYTP